MGLNEAYCKFLVFYYQCLVQGARLEVGCVISGSELNGSFRDAKHIVWLSFAAEV